MPIGSDGRAMATLTAQHSSAAMCGQPHPGRRSCERAHMEPDLLPTLSTLRTSGLQCVCVWCFCLVPSLALRVGNMRIEHRLQDIWCSAPLCACEGLGCHARQQAQCALAHLQRLHHGVSADRSAEALQPCDVGVLWCRRCTTGACRG
jgi:hypothetical protein